MSVIAPAEIEKLIARLEWLAGERGAIRGKDIHVLTPAETLSDAAAALRAVAPGVRVKPLDWAGPARIHADDAWGGYSITNVPGPDETWDWFSWAHSSRGDCDESDVAFATEAEAKAAAQADYEARILATLDTPAPVSDAGADSTPGLSTPQSGEVPASSAPTPAPAMELVEALVKAVDDYRAAINAFDGYGDMDHKIDRLEKAVTALDAVLAKIGGAA